jgi:hypothetical protein
MLLAIGVIILCGAIGGVVNAFITDNGFFFPKMETVDNKKIWRPGALSNILIGAFAAVLIWALYGRLSELLVIQVSLEQAAADPMGLTLGDIGGALITGFGGGRVITAEADKRLLTEATTKAAGSPSDKDAAAKIGTVSPAEALQIAQKMSKS